LHVSRTGKLLTLLDAQGIAEVKVMKTALFFVVVHGSLNVPIEHHPTIRYMVYNGYYKVMSNIPKMGQLPTPVVSSNFILLLQ
jgi:hypothetical protein